MLSWMRYRDIPSLDDIGAPAWFPYPYSIDWLFFFLDIFPLSWCISFSATFLYQSQSLLRHLSYIRAGPWIVSVYSMFHPLLVVLSSASWLGLLYSTFNAYYPDDIWNYALLATAQLWYRWIESIDGLVQRRCSGTRARPVISRASMLLATRDASNWVVGAARATTSRCWR